MKKNILYVSCIAILSMLLLSGCVGENKVATAALGDVVGKRANVATNEIKSAGFKNVNSESNGDKSMFDSSNWVVVSQAPTANESLPIDTEIKLLCQKIDTYMEKIVGQTVPDANSFAGKLGYTVEYYHETSRLDYTSELSAYPTDELQRWIVTSVKDINEKKENMRLYVNTAENAANNEAEDTMKTALNSKLDSATAMQFVEKYGETKYPYGFKLHYIADVQASRPVDENTWFFKIGATVTNEYGAEEKMTCESEVTGTTASPEVISFLVY